MAFRVDPIVQQLMVIFCLSFCPHADAGDKPTSPERIASVNICIDQLLWSMVPHERLVSLSYLTADPRWSAIASQLTGLALNHGLAEEIIPLRPDIVLASTFDNPDGMRLLQRLGVNVQFLVIPRLLEDLSQQVIQLGDLVGMPQEAALMASDLNQHLQELANHKPPQSLTAFWYSSNGVVIGDGTLEHELMQLAGLRNLAAERGLYGFNPLDLELLLSARPDLLIIEESSADAFSLAREYLSHPALMKAEFRIIHLPGGLSGCAAAKLSEVTRALQQALVKQH